MFQWFSTLGSIPSPLTPAKRLILTPIFCQPYHNKEKEAGEMSHQELLMGLSRSQTASSPPVIGVSRTPEVVLNFTPVFRPLCHSHGTSPLGQGTSHRIATWGLCYHVGQCGSQPPLPPAGSKGYRRAGNSEDQKPQLISLPISSPQPSEQPESGRSKQQLPHPALGGPPGPGPPEPHLLGPVHWRWWQKRDPKHDRHQRHSART